MTSTKVTQAAGAFLDAVGVGAAGSVDDLVTNSFSQVMDRTKQGLDDVKAGTKQENPAAAKTPVKVERSIQEASDRQTKQTDRADKEAVMADSSQTEAEDAAEEIVNAAADEIREAVKDELELTDEELEAIMASLGLSQADLLRPENLQAIVMAAAGETDQMSILTNETLYQSLQELTAVVTETITAAMEQLDVDEAAWNDLLSRMETVTDAEQPEQMTVQAENEPIVLTADSRSIAQIKSDAEAADVTEIDQTADMADAEQTDVQISQQTQEASTEENAAEHEAADKESTPRQDDHVEHSNPFMQAAGKTGIDAWSAENVQNGIEAPFEQADVENIMRQVTDYMKLEAGTEQTELELQLQPETLGTLRIHLTAKEGVVTAQFTTETEAVKAVLEAQAVQLRENLNDQGIKVEAVEVTVANQGFERSFAENGESAAGNEEPKKKSVRRIQLTEDTPLDELELSDEDRLTAEMMEMNGNTVDYTA